MSGPYVGLTGNIPRDPTTGALLVSAGSGQPPITVTRDGAGLVTGVASTGETVDQITRSGGRIATFRLNGTVYTVARAGGRISGVS